MKDAIIRAEALRFSYTSAEGVAPVVLDGVDLSIQEGTFVAVPGHNGSGKSTFLKNVYKVLRPQAGELTLMGDDLLAMSNREMAQRLAVMVQEQEAAFDFTVEEVVMMGRQARKRLLESDSREDRALVGEILARTGLASLREQGFSTLSGGEKQRVLIARALAQQTAVLVLDGRGRALTAAAAVKGMRDFRPDSGIRGVILNRVSPMLYPRLKEAIEGETGVTVYGYLPNLPGCALESRHLGLVTADEVADLREKLRQLAEAAEKTLELDALLENVNSDEIRLSGNSVTLGAGQAIDLGGIAKGYTSDCVEAVFRENKIESGKISLGGNVFVLGGKPDGADWRVGIRDPQDENALAAVLTLRDAFTSGGYERYFTENGNTYHHIIDPSTGYPADSGLLSVTVVAEANGPDFSGPGNGTMCDAFSTALFVMGEERALEFWQTGGYDFDLVLVTADGRVIITDGLSDRFEVVKDSGYTYETVS